jgi:RNA polymerase sigma-70 factor (ECF subfamily)
LHTLGFVKRPVTDRADRDGKEAGWIAALTAGDEEAGSRLVRENGGRMRAVARRLLRSDEEARDALQDAFVQAHRALPRFQGGSLLSTWLHRIVVNAALMRIRRRKARPEEPLDPLLPTFLEDGHSTVPYAAWPESAETMLQRSEVRIRVRTAIDRLPETARTVLLLRDIEELDTATVAEMLGVTPNAVKIRLHRARQALRQVLDPAVREETP